MDCSVTVAKHYIDKKSHYLHRPFFDKLILMSFDQSNILEVDFSRATCNEPVVPRQMHINQQFIEVGYFFLLVHFMESHYFKSVILCSIIFEYF